eukprot:TRINITY_DN1745_c0_g2_i10.p1 TRINITY_DN1745_c0_g2~~TRINITY_DN1745_c0_g2_i10.p1  ORF type:complete len:176 (+),score=18.81 TRINITY_DN1745_c0_g2_i10:166-693(+)
MDLQQYNCGSGKTSFRKAGKVRGPEYPELDKHLLDFHNARRTLLLVSSRRILQLEASRYAEEKGLNNFKASAGFISNFLKRHNLVHRRVTSMKQKIPDDWRNQVKNWQKNYTELVRKFKIKEENIYNMDETSIHFDSPYQSSLEMEGTNKLYYGQMVQKKKIALWCFAFLKLGKK